MCDGSEELINKALNAKNIVERRNAFIKMLKSDEWRQVLAPHVISRQGFLLRKVLYPDWETFRQSATCIAQDERKVQRSLELVGTRFGDELLYALARTMGRGLVEPTLQHLSSSDGVRTQLLQNILNYADPTWVRFPSAQTPIRSLLRGNTSERAILMKLLARQGNLANFIDELYQHPPISMEEWSALGRSSIYDESLFYRALAIMPHAIEPLAYLLRLQPIPDSVFPRMMAAARNDWVIAALELALIDGIDSSLMIPVAELGIRMGGQSLGLANSWIGSSKLVRRILSLLDRSVLWEDHRRKIDPNLWTRRVAPSADRALEQGRNGTEPDPLDVAALVRQISDDKLQPLIEEILTVPKEALIDSVLHQLCAVNLDAARYVVSLTKHPDPLVAERAYKATRWPDVAWPELSA